MTYGERLRAAAYPCNCVDRDQLSGIRSHMNLAERGRVDGEAVVLGRDHDLAGLVVVAGSA